MKVFSMWSASWLLVVVLATLFTLNSAEETEDICHYFPNNTQIRDPDSCNKYITCIDFVSHYSTCSGTTPFFDKSTNKCVKSLSDDTVCSVSCTNSTGKFIEDPKSCKGYYYCYDEELAAHGTCPDTQHFDVTTQSCTYKYESECRYEQFDYCAIVKDGVNFRAGTACHEYYTCAKGVLITKTCTKKYYDPIKGACADKAQVECLAHPVPKGGCGTEKKPKKNVFIADGATCRGYFYCAEQADGTPDANPVWGQCPPDLFFNEKKGNCVDPMEVKCTWDRCDGRTLPFVTASTKGCRHYLRCIDGIAKETLTCGNLFFDEKQGVCTTEIINKAACNT